MDLKIGKVGRETFVLPLGVVSDAQAVMGLRGKGKTSTVVVMVEEALDNGVQVIIIDPTDVWWGLKSSKSGKSGGYPVVILGGPHGDLPLTAEGGVPLADFAVENRVPMILSLRHLRKGAAQRFVAEFLEQLYHRKGEPEHRRPLLVVMDEASRYVPQKVMNEKGSYLTRSVGAVEDIVRQGRASGFGIIMLDQRPASVNKDVLTQIELLVAHAVTSPQDRAALDEWVKGKDTRGHREEFLRDLASLEKGEAWFWRPSSDLFARVRVRDRRTFDSSKTPEIGEEAATPEKFAKVDLGALQAQLEAAVADAIENDPKRLRKRIAELERECEAYASGPAIPPGISNEEYGAGVSAAVADYAAKTSQRFTEEWQRLQESAREPIERLAGLFSLPCPEMAGPGDGVVAQRVYKGIQVSDPVVIESLRRSQEAARIAPQRAPRKVAAPTAGEITGPMQRILNSLAWWESVGLRPANDVQVALVAGYGSVAGGAYRNPKGALRSGGYVIYPQDGMIELTPDGRKLAEMPDVPRTRSALHQMVLLHVKGPEQRILRPLLDAYPDELARQQVAKAAGYESTAGGAFRNPLGHLRSLGLVTYPQDGSVRAADVLFPRGLR